jgi:endoglucanase
LFPLIKDLTELNGPVGHEGAVADYLLERWGRSCERVWKTPVGNVVGYLGGSGPKLLLEAHMDEINLIVKSISPDGFLWLTHCHSGNNTYHIRECLNRRALVQTENGYVEGIFATLTGHLRFSSKKHTEAPGWDDIFIDLGLSSREEVLALGIHPGCPVMYEAEARRVGKHITMKAADDRIGLVIMTAVAELVNKADLKYETYLVGTIQEETGLVGAHSIRADLGNFAAALTYEVGLAGDIPVTDEKDMPVRLGGGPCIVHKDSSVHYDSRLTRKLANLAVANNIPHQHVLFYGFGADGSSLMKQGIPSAMIAPPTRYSHSPHEMVNEEDVRNCVRLSALFCTTDPAF